MAIKINKKINKNEGSKKVSAEFITSFSKVQ